MIGKGETLLEGAAEAAHDYNSGGRTASSTPSLTAPRRESLAAGAVGCGGNRDTQ